MLLLLRTALHDGFRAGVWTVLGIATGLLGHCVVILAGFGAVMKAFPQAHRAIALAGAGYLLWIAYQLFRSAWVLPRADAAAPEPLPPGAAFRRGLITNLTNVKAFVFLASFLGLQNRSSAPLAHHLLLVIIVVGQAMIGWTLFVRLLQDPSIAWIYRRSERLLNMLFAVGLTILALTAAFTHI